MIFIIKKNLVKAPTCFKNTNKPSFIDLLLTNSSKTFQDAQFVETGLKMLKMLTVVKMIYTKQKHNTVSHRDYKTFDIKKLRTELEKELMIFYIKQY